jgi:predicted small lipoprotein YifL
MKIIATIAAIAALTTLTACGGASAPAEAPATDVITDAVNTEVVEVPAENTGGPCGDGTVLAENEKCK